MIGVLHYLHKESQESYDALPTYLLFESLILFHLLEGGKTPNQNIGPFERDKRNRGC